MEPVAIVGIGCRFPGADGPRAFWRLLRGGVDSIGEVPPDRWNGSSFYDGDPAAPGKMSTRWGGFLKQIDGFDASFFGISPREAVHMDPQQRLLLEVTWEALEDAGQVRESLAGKPVGVFIGISTYDYGGMQLRNPLGIADGYLTTGSALSIAANRISYFFDFRGPSMAVDTACSSSLVAAHLACQSLWSGESALAVAGGVNAILSPAITIGFSKLKAMAADGRCKAFDARADGFVRSEGAGIVVLKLLSKAVADGDPIYAVIRSIAVNQDGRTNGLTAPNGLSQEDLVRRALAQGGVAPSEVSYVEAHGTGTALGDPIELNALGNVLAEGRSPGRRCAVGSVKANIGHLEAAAGVAGLVKVALSLKHREIPASIHFQEPNPYIPFDDLPLFVQQDLSPWPGPGPAYACVSSFGFGGTNACAVLQEAPAAEPAIESEPIEGQSYLLPLSASTPAALGALAASYRDLLQTAGAGAKLRDVAYTASTRRTHLDHRLAIVAQSPGDLIERLEAIESGETRPGMSSGRKVAGRRPKLAFVFSGHGAQWLGMGRALLSKERVFREELDRCDRVLRSEVSWSLLALLHSDESETELGRVGVIQPAVFAIQVALAALWRHWGIEPDAVVGHSMGEVAAAHVAGILTLEDAAKVICRRSQLLKRISGQGAMASVELSADEARDVLNGYEDRVSIGAVNSRRTTVLSGEPQALTEILKTLEDRGVYSRSVKTDVAFHGPQVDPLTASLRQELEGLRPRPASLPLYSTVTGSICEGPELDAGYWARNLREPVVFSTAVRELSRDGHHAFLEVSPHPVLLPAIQQELNDPGVVLLPSMKRGEDEQAVMLGSLGVLYTMGRPIAWKKLCPEGRTAPLPSYPWQRERFWIEELSSGPVAREAGGSGESHGVVSAFYDSLSQTRSMHELAATGRGDAYLTFAPFRSLVPGFSFLNAFFNAGGAESGELLVRAQKELRAALFGRVDFSGVAKVLDFGCGYSSDLIALAEKHRQLRLDGFTISPEQAAIGSERVRARNLGDRVRVFNRNSAAQEFPDQYDVVFGFEVAGHIEDKQGLFSNVTRHLAKSGMLLMADFVANTTVAIDHDELGTYASTKNGWADVLAQNGLRIVECIDVSEEIANSLDDPNFESNLERLGREQEITEIVRKNLRSFNNYGKALRRGFLDYYLFIAQADSYLRKGELLRINEEKLDAPVPYAEGLRRSTWLADEPGIDNEAAEASPVDCVYRVEWEPKALPTEEVRAASGGGNGRWMIFADEGGFGRELHAALTERGARSFLVSTGAAYERVDGKQFRVRPGFRDDIDRLLKEAGELDGAVHLWSLDAAPPGETTVDSLQRAQTLGCGSVVQLIQSIAGRGSRVAPRVWLVSAGLQAEGGRTMAAPCVAQAPLWGLGRAIAQEHPALWGGLIALEDVAPEESALLLSREILGSDGEDQVALRSDGRYVARLVRAPEASAPGAAVSVREDASYLITGGLGDLGLAVARYLVEQGARSLILLGRTKLLPRSEWSRIDEASRMHQQVAAIRELESLGAKVEVASVDVSEEAQMRAFLDRWSERGGEPIRGVVHAAGWAGIRGLLELDLDTLGATMRPKVAGGWILHRCFENRDLHFFVLFSSAASVLGVLGQGLGHYAAANAFLDGLAHYRHFLGLPALSINWGPWSGIGMAARTDQASRLEPHGIRSFIPQAGLELLGRLLARDTAQVLAADVDWPRLSRSFPSAARSPLLSKLVTPGESKARTSAPAGGRSLSPEKILCAEPAERRRLLESELRQRVSAVLGLSPSRLDVHMALVNLGMDSLMGVELKNQIESELGVNVSLIELMQGASVARLASMLVDKLEEIESPEAREPRTVAAPRSAAARGG